MSNLRLEKMTPEEFEVYLPHIMERYTEELMRNLDMSREAAQNKANKDVQEALSEGVDTPGHLLYTIYREEDSEKVGILHVKVVETAHSAWVSDIEIQPDYRGKGYGQDALILLEEQMRRMGIHTLGLNVFGDNPIARHLYESLGYHPTFIQMSKHLFDK